jgi:hypothetical protein
VALVLLVLGGCVRPPAEPDAPDVPTTATPTIDLPPRPRDVPLDGLDPCTLLTPHLAELELEDRDPLLTVASTRIYGGESSLCTARGYEPRAIGVGIDAITIAGIERYTVEGVDATVDPVDVRGFPAVLVFQEHRPQACTVIVDVSAGQLLDVQFRDGGRLPPIPLPTLCEDAQRTAGLAMDTLLTLR